MEKKDFFKKLLSNFRENHVRYVFLRGQEFISDKSKYKEMDILVRNKDLKKVKNISGKFSSVYETKANIDLTHPFLVNFVGENFTAVLDFQTKGVGYCGSAILKENYLLQNSVKKKTHRELNEEARFFMLLIHGFIFKKRLKYFEKYEKEFFILFNRLDKKDVFRHLTYLFNKSYAVSIIKYLHKKDTRGLFALRSRLVFLHLKKNPKEVFRVVLSKVMRFINYFRLRKIAYGLNPLKWAPLICFIGPDGSGKSTFSKLTKEYFGKFGIKSVSFSGGVFSRVRNPFSNISNVKTYSERIASDIRPSNLSLFIRFLMQIPNQIKIAYFRKRGFIVITDRYIYDLIFFYKANGFIRKITKFFSQKPTICFYLKVKAKNLLKRNRELGTNAINVLKKRIENEAGYLSLKEIGNDNLKISKKLILNCLDKVIKNV